MIDKMTLIFILTLICSILLFKELKKLKPKEYLSGNAVLLIIIIMILSFFMSVEAVKYILNT